MRCMKSIVTGLSGSTYWVLTRPCSLFLNAIVFYVIMGIREVCRTIRLAKNINPAHLFGKVNKTSILCPAAEANFEQMSQWELRISVRTRTMPSDSKQSRNPAHKGVSSSCPPTSAAASYHQVKFTPDPPC